MSEKNLKKQIYRELSQICGAMANQYRLEILEVLSQGAFSVEQIAGKTGLTIANTSQHLQKLKNARLVKTRRSGKQVFYELSGQQVYQAWKSQLELGLSLSAELQSLMQEYRNKKDHLESIDVQTLKEKIRNNEVLVIDVRPKDDFESEHIPGALSIPLDSLDSYLDQLPDDKQIVAYCRGELCAMADEATEFLTTKGFSAIRFEEGVPGWKSMGYPIETS